MIAGMQQHQRNCHKTTTSLEELRDYYQKNPTMAGPDIVPAVEKFKCPYCDNLLTKATYDASRDPYSGLREHIRNQHKDRQYSKQVLDNYYQLNPTHKITTSKTRWPIENS